jgi:hypothetical protein
LTVVKNKVKHPKVCFTIECHLCHIDDHSILAAIVRYNTLVLRAGFKPNLAFVCKTLDASPDSRNLTEDEGLLNAKHIILCESSGKTAINVYALCLQTTTLNSAPHCIEGTFKIS